MYKSLLVLFLFSSSLLFSQSLNANRQPGSFKQFQTVNGIVQERDITFPTPELPELYETPTGNNHFSNNPMNNSSVRWNYFEPVSIGAYCQTSQNGLGEVTGWWLNNERVSLYGNANSNPVWEFFTTNSPTYYNYVAISDAGGFIASGSNHNICIFNNSSSTPIFNFDLVANIPDTGNAGPVDITSAGNFIIASASRNDSSYVFGFSKDSTHWTWRFRVGQTLSGGAAIQGIKICDNDSLAIVNTYGGFYVVRTYTGQVLTSGSIGGTQTYMGISGNGNLIAIINYSGQLKVYQRSGNTYSLLWAYGEGGSSWMSAVDISSDGQYIAAGTLNFLAGGAYDGRLRLFRTTTGQVPISSYTGMGDEVTGVSFSKNGNVLSASTWGDLNNLNPDLYVFKTSAGVSSPLFTVNTNGSFFWCSTSADGSTVFASGKGVHARAFGSGGLAYNVFIDTNDAPLGILPQNQIPVKFDLMQNYPNPFNPSTEIEYSIAKDGFVNISVFDVLGREVRTLLNKVEKQGNYKINFDASSLPSGVYFYKMKADGNVFTKKMMLIK